MESLKPKIAMLLSGGVDSSVALCLLKQQGFSVDAFYLKIWLEDELAYLGNCPWEEDLSYATAVCEQLDVPFSVVSMQQEYWDRIVSYTISEVKRGRTPSPDILCNERIKFGAFLEKVDGSYEKIATGHYAQLAFENDLWLLKKANDPIKDQTYFLSSLNQTQLSRLMFPIGSYTKKEVRELAHQCNLPTKNRKDSQGICFLGKISFSDFIRHHLGDRPGDFIEYETGQRVGGHQGFWYFTIGQRKGMGLSGGPWFVVKKDTERNIVYISKQYFSEEKKRNTFRVTSLCWTSGKASLKKDLSVRVRHGEHLYTCELSLENETSGIVRLIENDQGLAPGQFAVFYDGDICLGCGVIDVNIDGEG